MFWDSDVDLDTFYTDAALGEELDETTAQVRGAKVTAIRAEGISDEKECFIDDARTLAVPRTPPPMMQSFPPPELDFLNLSDKDEPLLDEAL